MWSTTWLRPALLVAGLLSTSTSVQAKHHLGAPEYHGGDWRPEYVLVATAQNITINCESRYSVTFNQTSPGPMLRLQEGKTTWVRVWNRIPDNNLTVHWHGLSQRVAPFSDGVPTVSQWPIAPDQYFDYELHPESGDAGTYFYHSHVGFQAVTARGLLIVDDEEAPPERPYQYDGDIPLVFADYYPHEDSTVEAGLAANPFVWAGEPTAVVLNDRTGNASLATAKDDSCKPYIITVEPGKTYRMRFVNEAALSFLMVGIQGHSELTIIEADGHYTKPANVSYIQFGSGQRYSVLFKAKTEQQLDADGLGGNYWIQYEARDRPSNPFGWGILHYKTQGCGGQPKESALPQNLPAYKQPVTLPTNPADYTRYLEYTLEQYDNAANNFPSRSEVTRTVYITVNQLVVDGFYNGSVRGGLEWYQNNLTYSDEEAEALRTVPYLIQAYQGETPDYAAALANNGWDPKTRAWPAEVGEVLDIVWLSNSGPTSGYDNHPMHAHGEHFWDLGSGNGTYDAAENDKHFESGYKPARRDTTMLYRYMPRSPTPFYTSGWRAWRIRITEDNVGAWMMHCHILAHMAMGMQTVWVFGNAAQIIREIPEPYVTGYLTYGGSAYGNATYDPLVVPWFGLGPAEPPHP
ncbi:L-ascorbate oxidase [Microdochium trichocladiopsis]|uniref:L-ascorbate oxidase n=1 Tax=Microdochium trichocladiopsis TaxID=1682393 RepID=A0A9P8YHJ1_9PEZI|nr:L-ascorbate oxidase [Microdochium trichocladiopsis]KAH7038265.1 L-ascorbate oxidase [Microdochium trichocladiopsis]